MKGEVNASFGANASVVKLLLFLFYIFIPIDMVSGLIDFNADLSPSIFYKSLVLVLVTVYMIFGAKNTKVALLITYLLVWMGLYYASNGDLFLVVKSSIMLIKFISIFIFIEFFHRAFDYGHKKQIRNIIYASYTFFVINLGLGILGYGKSMYSGDGVSIGSKGLINAGNELGVAFLSAFILLFAVKLQRNLNGGTIYISISGFILAGIMALKTALIGVFIISLHNTYAQFRSGLNGLKLKRRSAKIALNTLVALLFLTYFIVVFIIPRVGIIERWAYFFGELDLLTFVLSSRNIFAEQALEVYFTQYNLIERLLGTGQQWQLAVPSKKLVEIDFIDFLMTYGLFGASIVFLLPLNILLSSGISKQNVPGSILYAGAWLLFVLSFIAGHVFNSGTAGYLIAILFSIIRKRDVNAI